MNHSLKKGLSFGLTSGVITTLGVMIGLFFGTHSKLAVVGGVISVAIADAFSDGLGMHISEESEKKSKTRAIWEATASTFFAKFIFAASFLIPVWLLDLSSAIIASVAWGLLLLTVLSYFLAKNRKEKAWKVITEHVTIMLVVIVLTYFVGDWIGRIFI